MQFIYFRHNVILCSCCCYAAFSFFMFTVYSVFAIFLVIFREKIGAGEEVTDKDTEDEEAERF